MSISRPLKLPLLGALLGLIIITAAACGASGEEGLVTPPDDVTPYRGLVVSPALPKPDFVMPDLDGESYDFRHETRDRVTLLYFGYTHCPDICPSHMADIASVLKRNPELADKVEVVFVTVDPERDTPERMRLWLGLFSEDFVGLIGTPEEIQAAADAALGSMSFPIEHHTGEHGDYSVTHAAVLIAYTQDNLAHLLYPFGVPQADYEHDLTRLVREGWRNP